MVLKDLLEQEKFRYLKVLNKSPDLNRTIITVESTETPDVAKYIPRNTLLLMTGMAFKNDPSQMRVFLEELNQRECAAVAIKLGRFIHALDTHILETADLLGICVLQIPMEKTLGEVYQEILSYIWNNQNDNLLRAVNAQQKISNLILQGSSMKSIINNISLMLNKPILIIDLFGNILGYGYTCTSGDRRKAVESVEMLMNKKEMYAGNRYSIFEKSGSRYCVYPIKGIGRYTNYVVISDFDPKEKEEYPLIMEQVILALELYFFKNLYAKYNSIKSRSDFLTVLLEQMETKTQTEKQLFSIGGYQGLKKMKEYKVIILDMEESGQRKFNTINFSKREERYILCFDWMSHLLDEQDNILIFPQESKWRYLCVVQGKDTEYRNRLVDIHDRIKEKFNLNITISQGGFVSSVLNIPNSLEEAEQGLKDGTPDKEYPYLLSFKPKGIMELFKFIPEREVRYVCESTLKELAYPQNQMEEELRKTLSVYLSCGNSITKTAEILYVHRNTIKYRLKKCEEILGEELSDVSDCFRFQLALVLTEYTW